MAALAQSRTLFLTGVLSALAGSPWQSSIGPGGASSRSELLLSHRLLASGYVLPDRPLALPATPPKAMGGLTLPVRPGIHPVVAYLDF